MVVGNSVVWFKFSPIETLISSITLYQFAGT